MKKEQKQQNKIDGKPEEWVDSFKKLDNPRDIAKLLGIDYERLVYHIYKVPDEVKYTVFHIKKRGAGSSERTICAPATPLKLIQANLAQILSKVYIPKATVHGFCKGRSILSNANKHVKQKYVLNIDLLGFFPSINFGRVRGLFMAEPYCLNEKVSTVLAQICCFNNEIPQGAPTELPHGTKTI